MSQRRQQTLPVVRASPSGFNSDIQGDVAVVSFVRKISAELSYAEAEVIDQFLAGAAAIVLAAAFTGVQNDVPRTLILQDNGVGNSGDVVVTGYDQYGELVSETLTITPAGATEGNVPFTWITQISYPLIANLNVEIQMGNKIGVAADLQNGDLKAVAHDPAGGGAKSFYNVGRFALDTIYDTIEFTGVATAVADVFDYHVKG